ncbi:MAG: hypothetical protein NNA23_03625 [Nitrospira sp.]|nr:hypothetical protein [Nitrospira sp.]
MEVGTNLFSLRSVPAIFRRLLGIGGVVHSTPNRARNCGAFPNPRCGLRHIDLFDEAYPAFHALEWKPVFAYHCLEQLWYYMGVVIDAILEARSRRVIHIEPARELLNPFRLLDLNCIVYSLPVDYPDNLLTNLQQRE